MEEVKITPGQRKKLLSRISELEHRLARIERTRAAVRQKNRKVSPQETMTLIQEIKVPALELLKQDRKKNK